MLYLYVGFELWTIVDSINPVFYRNTYDSEAAKLLFLLLIKWWYAMYNIGVHIFRLHYINIRIIITTSLGIIHRAFYCPNSTPEDTLSSVLSSCIRWHLLVVSRTQIYVTGATINCVNNTLWVKSNVLW